MVSKRRRQSINQSTRQRRQPNDGEEAEEEGTSSLRRACIEGTLVAIRAIAKNRKVPKYKTLCKEDLVDVLLDGTYSFTVRELRLFAGLKGIYSYSLLNKDELTKALGIARDAGEAAGSSTHEMGPGVAVYPQHLAFGGNCYKEATLSFFCNLGRVYVLDSLILEWKISDIVSIESRWSDTSETANICIRIKSEQPKAVTTCQNSGILEVDFSVLDPDWVSTQDKIKSLDAHYMEKWDVDLDSYESFEGKIECGSILISEKDFKRLQPRKFINDTIVDFYVENLKKIKPADARVQLCNSLFFLKLIGNGNENKQSESIDVDGAFKRVCKWTKNWDIVELEYILIPVNFRLHWSLIIICHPGEIVNFKDDELASSSSVKVPCILHLDSHCKGSHQCLEMEISDTIRWYLWGEWKERNNNASEDKFAKFKSLRFLPVEVPQQQNLYDCALFMLHYMELFFKQAPMYFNPLNNFIDKDWFHPIEASLKRARIKRMICEIAKTNAKSSFDQSESLKNKKSCDELESLRKELIAIKESLKESKETNLDMEVALKRLVAENEVLNQRLHIEYTERRRLHNALIDIKGNIRVFCRCRPLNQEEISRGLTNIVEIDASLDELRVIGPDEKQFKFDHIFRPEDNQDVVFEQTSPLVVSVLDGFNVCIFAYGQTGTGKTFTMEGTAENRGVNYRTLEMLFRVSEERKQRTKFDICVSLMEVYMDKLTDLLVEKDCGEKLAIVRSEVVGLKEVHVHNINDVSKVLKVGRRVRSVGSTNANELSSRSHCLLRVTVSGTNVENGQETRSRLWLVDLAGSEGVAKTGAEGKRLEEAKYINKSLSALRNVIAALVSKGPHVPYRDSKLTLILENPLGGHCKTVMFVQISPSSADKAETLSSLCFARDARYAERGPAHMTARNASKSASKTASKTALKTASKTASKTAHNVSEYQRGFVKPLRLVQSRGLQP